jgi:hypothetical protein
MVCSFPNVGHLGELSTQTQPQGRRGGQGTAANSCVWRQFPAIRVSFEISFDSKQPKLEPKLVLALSETKRLFRLFRFYNETASFGVSIEPKQTEDQPKQTEMKA